MNLLKRDKDYTAPKAVYARNLLKQDLLSTYGGGGTTKLQKPDKKRGDLYQATTLIVSGEMHD
jgi:hypothetical protein